MGVPSYPVPDPSEAELEGGGEVQGSVPLLWEWLKQLVMLVHQRESSPYAFFL